MEKKMKILVISDIHGNTENIEKLANVFAESDFVLFAGDFAKFEHTETGKPALESLIKRHETIFSVLGNCDEENFIEELENADICTQKSMVFHDGLVIAGSGGGSKFTGTTPYERTDEELVSDFAIVKESLEQIKDKDGNCSNLILIMHNPPKNTKCDMIPGDIHVGSERLRAFIEETKPLLVVTGHIHESAGIDKIGETQVINPGSLAEGKYATVEIEKSGETWKIVNSELKSL